MTNLTASSNNTIPNSIALALAERERRQRQTRLSPATPEVRALEAQGYETWLQALFPSYTTYPLGAHHHQVCRRVVLLCWEQAMTHNDYGVQLC
ncbi:MAG: hypothetical protein AAGF95_29725 [Chloroflexota bacterium]